MRPKKQKFLLTHLSIIILYFLFTSLLTYPVISHLNTHVAGDGGDSLHNIWIFWWVRKALLDPNVDLYYTDYMYYPNGTSLAFLALTPFNSILSVPLQGMFSLLTIYNIIFLFHFVLAGYGMFLLVDHLTKDKRIAFISGLAYAFSPFQFAHGLGHLNIMSTGWIPFYVLFLFKTSKESSKKNPILAGLFLALASLCSWYFMIFLLIFTVIFFVHELILKRTNIRLGQIIIKYVLISSTFLILTLPFAYPMITEFYSSDYMKVGYHNYIRPYNYLIPSLLHPLFGDLVRELYFDDHIPPQTNPAESVVFFGYTIFVIANFAILKDFKKTSFFWITALLFYFLSLGLPPIQEGFQSFFPFFSPIRAPSRFSIMVIFCLIVLFSFGLQKILKKNSVIHGSQTHKKLTLFFISLLVMFEFLAVPYATTKLDVPEFYDNISKEKEDYAIFDIPVNEASVYLYYQTIHEKKAMSGYVSRTPYSAKETLEKKPFFRKFLVNSGLEKNWYWSVKTWFPYIFSDTSTPNLCMSQNATAYVFTPDKTNFEVILDTRSYYKTRNLEIYLNDDLIDEYEVMPNETSSISIKLSLKPGRNIVKVRSKEGCDMPSELEGINDDRCLSFCFDYIAGYKLFDKTDSELRNAYETLKKFDIKFVVIHKPFMFKEEVEETKDFISRIYNTSKVYEDDKIISFQIY